MEDELPLFPLGMVALPGEPVPLHIFEPRYRTMIGQCLEAEREFGIIWLAEDELKPIGCACAIEEVLERHPDGRLDILTRGTGPFALVRRLEHLPYPAGTVRFLDDDDEPVNESVEREARESYAELVARATDRRPEGDELDELDSYAMAASIDFGPEVKQGLLESRSEEDRLRQLIRLFRAAARRLDLVDRAQARARSNGKVRF